MTRHPRPIPSRSRLSAPPSRRAAGFTLMEILIVVFIIMGLLALTLAAGTYMREVAKSRQVSVILQTLQNAATEYRAQMGDDVSRPPSTWDSEQRSIEWFLQEARELPEPRQVIMTLNDHLEFDNDEPDFIEDVWETPIVYRHPDDDSLDGILPRRHRPYFASAGPPPDARTPIGFGDFRELEKQQRGEPHNETLAKQAASNIYSFELD